jgi:hypothetical protein
MRSGVKEQNNLKSMSEHVPIDHKQKSQTAEAMVQIEQTALMPDEPTPALQNVFFHTVEFKPNFYQRKQANSSSPHKRNQFK